MNGKKRNKERDTRINFASIYKLLHVTLHLHLKILRNYLLASYFSSRGDTSENCHPRRVSRRQDSRVYPLRSRRFLPQQHCSTPLQKIFDIFAFVLWCSRLNTPSALVLVEKTLIGLSVHSLRFSRLSSSPRARAVFSSSPLRKSRKNNSAEEKKRKKRGEEEEEEEAFFSFLRAHFYCLKYPRLHLNASARAS